MRRLALLQRTARALAQGSRSAARLEARIRKLDGVGPHKGELVAPLNRVERRFGRGLEILLDVRLEGALIHHEETIPGLTLPDDLVALRKGVQLKRLHARLDVGR